MSYLVISSACPILKKSTQRQLTSSSIFDSFTTFLALSIPLRRISLIVCISSEDKVTTVERWRSSLLPLSSDSMARMRQLMWCLVIMLEALPRKIRPTLTVNLSLFCTTRPIEIKNSKTSAILEIGSAKYLAKLSLVWSFKMETAI